MARRSRNDSPDAWFHLMNRAVARRTLFERAEDMDIFLSALAEARAREELEVHSYSLMTTHYHLMARSPSGDLGRGMQRVQTEYSRWFNRSRKRDGPLVRGRYVARRIDSLFYRRTVVRYIDWNAVRARLVSCATDYPYGSAQAYCSLEPRDDPWLERSWVEGEVCRALGIPLFLPSRYVEVFPALPPRLAHVVKSRWKSRVEQDPLADLINASPSEVLAWMREKAELADGTQPGLPVLAFEDLKRTLASHSKLHGSPWLVGRQDGWVLLCAGLAREMCGLRIEEIGEKLRISRSRAGQLTKQHYRLIRSNAEYAERAAVVTAGALEAWVSGRK